MACAGGSWAGANTESGVAVAITKNRLTIDDEAITRVVDIVHKGLE